MIFGIILFFLFFLFSFAEKRGANNIIILGGQIGDVPFPHYLHQNKLKNCDNCHKLFPKESNSISRLISKGQLMKKTVMNNCKRCHMERNTKGMNSGPVKCKACHSK